MKKAKTSLSVDQIETIRDRVMKSIAPLTPASRSQSNEFGATPTNAGNRLPPYYLVYFLLVELLKFPHTGREEKVAWTIPVDYRGSCAWIQHQKMGLGVFSTATEDRELVAQQIVNAIQRGVTAATPFFDHLASEAAAGSKLNVRNNSVWLLSRYEYLREQFREKATSAEARKGDVVKTEKTSSDGTKSESYSFPALALKQEAAWLGVAAIDAFFSWTEHVLIHIAVLRGRLKTGEDVAELAAANWSEKVKAAIGLDDGALKPLVDELLAVRRQIRNYLAHGAFGKQGEAFKFHSRAGAVPVNMTDTDGTNRFSIWFGESFDEAGAIDTADRFAKRLWDGDLAPAKIYIQNAGLPIILPYATDGTYERAMASVEDMKCLVASLTREMDNAANMDW
jgi:hypothetical protein